MFEILSEFPDGVLAVRGTGRITAEAQRPIAERGA